jgi:hypothetical protein
MKKIMLTLAGALFLTAGAVYAQDTTQRTDPSQRPGQEEPLQQPQDQYRSDLAPIPADQVPDALRKTLEGSEYKGWENATLYQNKNTKEYQLEMMQGDVPRIYRFDQNGQPIEAEQSVPEGQ